MLGHDSLSSGIKNGPYRTAGAKGEIVGGVPDPPPVLLRDWPRRRYDAGMNDVLLVALFSSAGAALVAIASAAATIYGPARGEREQRKQDRIDSSDSARYERALEYFESLTQLTLAGVYADSQDAYVKWSRFVATLRRGEGAVGAYAKMLLKTNLAAGNGPEKISIAAEKIFGWMRGDVPISEFEDPSRPS